MPAITRDIADRVAANDAICLETRFLVYVLLAGDTDTLPFRLDPRRLWHCFRLASSNRVLYAFCTSLVRFPHIAGCSGTMSLCNAVIEEGEKRTRRIRHTLERVSDAFEKRGIRFLVAKTCWFFPYIFNDIDVFVDPSQYEDAVSVLHDDLRSSSTRHWTSDDGKDLFEGPDIHKIDLHRRFTWLNSSKPFLDQELVWDSIQHKEVFGIRCPVPNITVEWALNAMNVMFERFYFTLNIAFTLLRDYESIDWALLCGQAGEHKWGGTLRRFLGDLRGFGRELGLGVLDTQEGAPVRTREARKPVHFPYPLSYGDMVRAYMEQCVRRGILDLSLMPYNLTYGRWKRLVTSGECVGIYGDWYPFGRTEHARGPEDLDPLDGQRSIPWNLR